MINKSHYSIDWNEIDRYLTSLRTSQKLFFAEPTQENLQKIFDLCEGNTFPYAVSTKAYYIGEFKDTEELEISIENISAFLCSVKFIERDVIEELASILTFNSGIKTENPEYPLKLEEKIKYINYNITDSQKKELGQMYLTELKIKSILKCSLRDQFPQSYFSE